MKKVILAFCIFFALAVYGCGLKPYPIIPEDVTVSQVLASFQKHSTQIKDFSATAFVKAKLKGEPSQSVNISIKYIAPDRFRIVIKGFAGIAGAIFTARSDSLSIYFPSENTFITLGCDDEPLRFPVPGIDLDFDHIKSIITGSLPTSEVRDYYQMSLEHHGKQAVLILKRGTTMQRYTFEGAEMRVVDEEISREGVIVWRKKIW